MMKYVILTVVLVGAMGRPQNHPDTAAAQSDSHPNVTIVSSTSENDGKGGFMWSYETSDGSKAEQQGHTIPPADSSTDSIQVIQGSYQYQGPDGKTYRIEYIADANGFQPKGDFLPVAPVDPNNPPPGAGRSDLAAHSPATGPQSDATAAVPPPAAQSAAVPPPAAQSGAVPPPAAQSGAVPPPAAESSAVPPTTASAQH